MVMPLEEKMLRKATPAYVPEKLKHAERPVTVMHRPLQMAFLAWLVVPVVAAALHDPLGYQHALAWHAATLARFVDYARSPAFVAACLGLAVERVCYTVIWCYPDHFAAWTKTLRGTWLNSGEDTIVDVVYGLFKINKFFQYGSFALLYATAPPIHENSISFFQGLVGANLIALGQTLNLGIYRAIGKVGVYYGYKFGIHVPWCTGFPFNVLSAHPQYLGSAMTAYGAVLLTATDAHVLNGWGGLAHVQALAYAYMSYVEHNL